MHTYIHACMHACMHTCIHACMHAYIHTYLHTPPCFADFPTGHGRGYPGSGVPSGIDLGTCVMQYPGVNWQVDVQHPGPWNMNESAHY